MRTPLSLAGAAAGSYGSEVRGNATARRLQFGALVAAALSLVLAACTSAPPPGGTGGTGTGGTGTGGSPGPTTFSLVVLGDSLSSAPELIAAKSRWHDLVADRVATPSGVRAHLADGVAGWTVTQRNGPVTVDHWDGTWGGFTTLSYAGQPWFQPPVGAPSLLAVALGANDVAVGATPAVYAANLRVLLDSYADTACLVVFPWWPSYQPSVASWSAAAATVAAERGCGFVDMGTAVGPPVAGVTARDDIHPNVLGQQLWADAVMPVVTSLTGRG